MLQLVIQLHKIVAQIAVSCIVFKVTDRFCISFKADKFSASAKASQIQHAFLGLSSSLAQKGYGVVHGIDPWLLHDQRAFT